MVEFIAFYKSLAKAIERLFYEQLRILQNSEYNKQLREIYDKYAIDRDKDIKSLIDTVSAVGAAGFKEVDISTKAVNALLQKGVGEIASVVSKVYEIVQKKQKCRQDTETAKKLHEAAELLKFLENYKKKTTLQGSTQLDSTEGDSKLIEQFAREAAANIALRHMHLITSLTDRDEAGDLIEFFICCIKRQVLESPGPSPMCQVLDATLPDSKNIMFGEWHHTASSLALSLVGRQGGKKRTTTGVNISTQSGQPEHVFLSDVFNLAKFYMVKVSSNVGTSKSTPDVKAIEAKPQEQENYKFKLYVNTSANVENTIVVLHSENDACFARLTLQCTTDGKEYSVKFECPSSQTSSSSSSSASTPAPLVPPSATYVVQPSSVSFNPPLPPAFLTILWDGKTVQQFITGFFSQLQSEELMVNPWRSKIESPPQPISMDSISASSVLSRSRQEFFYKQRTEQDQKVLNRLKTAIQLGMHRTTEERAAMISVVVQYEGRGALTRSERKYLKEWTNAIEKDNQALEAAKWLVGRQYGESSVTELLSKYGAQAVYRARDELRGQLDSDDEKDYKKIEEKEFSGVAPSPTSSSSASS